MGGPGELQGVQWLQPFGRPFDGVRRHGRCGAKKLKLNC